MSRRSTFLTTTAAALALGSTMAFAQITDEQILATYAGYTSIEITRGPTQIKVEAVRDGVKVETIYDLDGNILKSETERADGDEDSGVEIKRSDDDFLDDDEYDDDESDDEDDDDEDDDEDDDDESDDDEDDDEDDDHDEDDDEDDDHDEDDD